MKLKYTFLVLMLICFFGGHGQALKGISLGEKINGSKEINTTVGGYSGKLTAVTLKDGTVHTLHFLSESTVLSDFEKRMQIKNANEFLSNVEYKYNIKFDRNRWVHKEGLGYDVWDRAKLTQGKVEYDVTFNVDFDKGSRILMFVIGHKELQQKAVNERYFDKMDDF